MASIPPGDSKGKMFNPNSNKADSSSQKAAPAFNFKVVVKESSPVKGAATESLEKSRVKGIKTERKSDPDAEISVAGLKRVIALVEKIKTESSFLKKLDVSQFIEAVKGLSWEHMEFLAPHVPVPLLEDYMHQLPDQKSQDPHLRTTGEARAPKVIMKNIINGIKPKQILEEFRAKTKEDFEKMPMEKFFKKFSGLLNGLSVSEITTLVSKIPEDKFIEYSIHQSPDPYLDKMGVKRSRRTELLSLIVPKDNAPEAKGRVKLDPKDAIIEAGTSAKVVTPAQQFSSYDELLASKSGFDEADFAKVFQKTTKLPNSEIFIFKGTDYGTLLFESYLSDFMDSPRLSTHSASAAEEFLIGFKGYMRLHNEKNERFTKSEFKEWVETNRNLSESTKKRIGEDESGKQHIGGVTVEGKARIVSQRHYDKNQVEEFDGKIDALIEAVKDLESPSPFAAALAKVFENALSETKRAVAPKRPFPAAGKSILKKTKKSKDL